MAIGWFVCPYEQGNHPIVPAQSRRCAMVRHLPTNLSPGRWRAGEIRNNHCLVGVVTTLPAGIWLPRARPTQSAWMAAFQRIIIMHKKASTVIAGDVVPAASTTSSALSPPLASMSRQWRTCSMKSEGC